MPHPFEPCADPLSCPEGYQDKCHEPMPEGQDGECDLPKDHPVHTLGRSIEEVMTDLDQQLDDDYTEIGSAMVQEVMARLKPHIDLANYFFELPDPDRDDLAAYQVVASYHGPAADDGPISEAALAKITADVPLGMADFELTRSASTDVPLLAIAIKD